MSWTKEKFLAVLKRAHQAERNWVESRRDEGHALAHGMKLVLEGHNPRVDFCPTPDAVAAVALEIKVRGLEFTGPDDFPYATVFVDDVNGLSKGRMPFAWVYISDKTGEWVWLCSLDRDESWQEQTVYDTMRGFRVPTLVAPSKFLRPADQLCQLLFPADDLRWVEGDVGGFRAPAEADGRNDPAPRGRGRKAPKDPG